VDGGRSLIRIVPHDKPSANLLAMTTLSPTSCCTLTEAGQIEVAPTGCFEFGACLAMCEAGGDVEWNYPRGGNGVLFKFG
jgi:ferredoxin like protein